MKEREAPVSQSVMNFLFTSRVHRVSGFVGWSVGRSIGMSGRGWLVDSGSESREEDEPEGSILPTARFPALLRSRQHRILLRRY